MNNIPWDEIMKRLDAIAAKLTQGAMALWVVLLKQAVLDGLMFLLWALLQSLVGVAFVVCARKVFKHALTYDKGADGRAGFTAATVACSIGSIICFSLMVGSLSEGIPRLVNPAYYALANLINQLK